MRPEGGQPNVMEVRAFWGGGEARITEEAG
jgi:hypothetical protein